MLKGAVVEKRTVHASKGISVRLEPVVHFFIEPGVNELEDDFVIDTGSSHYIVRQAGTEELYRSRRLRPIPTTVRLADGKEIEVNVYPSTIILDDVRRDDVPTLLLGHENLVGMSFLKGLQLNFNVEVDAGIEIDLPSDWLPENVRL